MTLTEYISLKKHNVDDLEQELTKEINKKHRFLNDDYMDEIETKIETLNEVIKSLEIIREI